MIITRTPLRISLGGGGTDLPSYYEQAGHGFLIAAAITKYVYIAINQNFDDDILLKYSSIERASSVDDVQHPLLRECLRCTGQWSGIEISSMADIPTGTGLGSSGSFTVGVLKALHMYKHLGMSNVDLAAEACRIEIERLREPVGKQDQYIAALGGIRAFKFFADGTVKDESLALAPSTRDQIEENLVLFYTGVRRSASDVLAEERAASGTSAKQLVENLDRTRDIGFRTRDALESGDLGKFGALLTEQWQLKYERQKNATHDEIDRLIRLGLEVGALGGKLIGAGGGGFLMFYADQKAELRRAMADAGLSELRFRLDYEGSAVTVTH